MPVQSHAKSLALQKGQALAHQLPPLVVAALHTAENLTFGAHGRHKSGPGDSFFQYRHYMPGESTHRIDWRASAKGEHTYIRETEWEAAQKIYFWVDHSPSMDWQSSNSVPTKADRAQTLALALAALLLQGQEMVASLDGQLPPSRDMGSLVQLHETLLKATNSTPPQAELPRRAHIIAIGDFLLQAEETCQWLRETTHHGTPVLLVDVADPMEETFPYQEPTRFEGLEGEGEENIGNPKGLRAAYLERRENARNLLMETASRCNATYLTHLTNTPPEATLQKLYHLLNLKQTQVRGGQF